MVIVIDAVMVAGVRLNRRFPLICDRAAKITVLPRERENARTRSDPLSRARAHFTNIERN